MLFTGSRDDRVLSVDIIRFYLVKSTDDTFFIGDIISCDNRGSIITDSSIGIDSIGFNCGSLGSIDYCCIGPEIKQHSNWSKDIRAILYGCIITRFFMGIEIIIIYKYGSFEICEIYEINLLE